VEQLERDVERLACLEDDLRRRMYLFLRRQPHGLRRDEVAKEFGISSKLAAFHLDKLADAGLLAFHYARPPGRTGPGAGRPAKIYEPSSVGIDVSLPPRRYELVGTLLLDVIRSESAEGTAGERAASIAYDAGATLGRSVRDERRLRPPGVERALSVASEVLEEYGFEPVHDGERVILRNCPFHALARHAPELVCAMNRAFIEGLLRGLGNDTVAAELAPAEGRCCVTLCRADPTGRRR
jgi:predicted ArsR family transcriptional regulator